MPVEPEEEDNPEESDVNVYAPTAPEGEEIDEAVGKRVQQSTLNPAPMKRNPTRNRKLPEFFNM